MQHDETAERRSHFLDGFSQRKGLTESKINDRIQTADGASAPVTEMGP